MSRKNDITGAELVSKAATKDYQEGYDRIFGEKKRKVTNLWDVVTFNDNNIYSVSREEAEAHLKSEKNVEYDWYITPAQGPSPSEVARLYEAYPEDFVKIPPPDTTVYEDFMKKVDQELAKTMGINRDLLGPGRL